MKYRKYRNSQKPASLLEFVCGTSRTKYREKYRNGDMVASHHAFQPRFFSHASAVSMLALAFGRTV
jgi:hypothetical protein